MSSNTHIDFNSIKRVLVIKLRNHGDVLLTTPVFRTLKANYPHLEIDALVYKDTAPILEDNPYLNQCHLIDRTWKKSGIFKQLKGESGLARDLINRRFDLVIHLTEHHRGALVTLLTRPKYAITAINWKRTSWFWRKCFTHHYPVPIYPRHTIEVNLDSLRHLGLMPDRDEKHPLISSSSKTIKRIDDVLASHELDNRKFIVFHPTSRWMFKSWPESSSAKLIDMLSSESCSVVITSAPDKEELRYIEQLRSCANSQYIDLSGKLGLQELSELIKRADCFIGMDSLPMHIAAAHKTPTVALFGPSSELKWGPWETQHIIHTTQHSCRPCDLAGCGDGGISECINLLDPKAVSASVRSLLASNEEN